MATGSNGRSSTCRSSPSGSAATARGTAPRPSGRSSRTRSRRHEVADAAEAGDDGKLADELGDLLFQTVFLALLLEERGAGDLAGIARGIHAKLVRRHPHVFGDAELATPGAVKGRWEELKREQEERKDLPRRPGGAARAPEARKVQRRAAAAGFDWPDVAGPLAKVREEVDELEAELGETGLPAAETEPRGRSSRRSAISCSRS